MHIWSFVYSVSAWKTHSLPQIQWIVLYTLENILLKEKNIKKRLKSVMIGFLLSEILKWFIHKKCSNENHVFLS